MSLKERSPHPYHRRKEKPTRQIGKPYLPSPALTPYHSDGEEGGSKHGSYTPRRLALSRTPSESGSDLDGEGLGFLKALPPTSPKPHKGLKTGEDGVVETPSALEAPAQDILAHEEITTDYFRYGKNLLVAHVDSDDVLQAKLLYKRRRNSELIRRAAEVIMLFLVACGILSHKIVQKAAISSQRELVTYFGIFLLLCLAYIVRVILLPMRISPRRIYRLRSLHIPSSFDPAPLLYPAFLPVFVSLSLVSAFPAVLTPNIILSISALPIQMLSSFEGEYYYHLHWLLSLLPLIAAERTQWFFSTKLLHVLYALGGIHSEGAKSFVRDATDAQLFPENMGATGIERENLALLFPLQQLMLPPLYYLTTTSLLPAELQLSAICLINLLLFSQSPEAVILASMIWIGGLGLFIFCGKVLRWNVALERIPRWRFQRAARVIRARTSFISTLLDGLRSQKDSSAISSTEINDCDPNHQHDHRPGRQITNGAMVRSKSSGMLPQRVKELSVTPVNITNGPSTNIDQRVSRVLTGSVPKRRSTIASNEIEPFGLLGQLQLPRKYLKSLSSSVQICLSLTPSQATRLKWLYAIYTYLVVVFLVLLPIRILIQKYALEDQEPIGWAIGYLFGNTVNAQKAIEAYQLTTWVPFPRFNSSIVNHSTQFYGLLSHLPPSLLAPSNLRLMLLAYWLVVVALGIAVVIHLSVFVEVDTRRKVFHGMMVAILLPTTFIDPTFLALCLSIVLGVFFLLDLFRAAQLRPLSQPLARFLTPYVDGRDLRGPVVISHMFLLIGCAIPLWLSLAGTKHLGDAPWRDWELATRDVSMVAGVICVGMGDAAASLVGRRFGRRKWPWLGGKSLEGSAAFAGAVTLGLMFAKVWLKLGQWEDAHGYAQDMAAWIRTLQKAVLAAFGASFTEAILTGANDNVVVPIVLWLLVRGLRI